MGDAISFRELHAGRDGPEVAALFCRCRDYLFLETGLPDAELADGPGWAAEFFAEPPGPPPGTRVLRQGLYLGGRLGGIAELAACQPGAATGLVALLLLAPELRGRGLGRLMLAELSRISRGAGLRRLELEVLTSNPRGLAFWQREGFRILTCGAPHWTGQHLHRRFRLAREIGGPAGGAAAAPPG